ncbi:hypothetical protein [Nocardia camponoti]|uniref:Uncharacterized protein n=1 Tax=Nocardia camponoti TaxID=1616106 RepID=A0A917VEL4_9NOCA|nr:hypothetical protein [Nocardia camponoti]GGK66730.1 hypothetical protein GCM10011591_43610 [Nocardia camponoti]
MPDAMDHLTATLGSPPPPEFATLTAEELTLLESYLRTALDSRKEALAGAVDSGMRMVPRLARPAVKRVLGL